MFNELPVHDKTAKAIENYLSSPAQVAAIIGAESSGQFPIANHIAKHILKTDNDNNPNIIRLDKPADKSEIPIDEVRKIISLTRLKSTARVIIINDAQTMSIEAQNALLKLLEEPNNNNYFLLVLSSEHQVLPTVLSRSTKLVVHPVSFDSAKNFYKNNFSENQIKSAWLLSDGAAEELDNTLKKTDQQKNDALSEAKEYLRSDRYSRLITIDAISKDRLRTLSFLEALSRSLKALHHAQIEAGNGRLATKLLASRKLSDEVTEAIKANASTKLNLLHLTESFPI